ncbi:uncharacterized protein [Triticum aestivum]|uniref:uncharacterized protein isoform X2 n=1 Tax=Triticum aestivum TaxID=4565 RepID=UPI001D01D6BF|nr:uncharacterized protein LOC123053403 isoform X2 [Triticum aestivum]
MGKTKTCSSHMPLPRARLAPRAGGLMMEDLHSWLHRRRRYHFCFCSPLAHSAAIGGAMEYCRGTDAASVGAACMAVPKEMATGEEELNGVLIVGGGICGLATALALHMYLLRFKIDDPTLY